MSKWILKDSRKIFTSKYISLKENSYTMPDGSTKDNYYLIERPDYVLIVALNSNGEVLVETNYRPGPDAMLVELPAGWINNDESPLEAASRELLEETGYRGEASYLGYFYLAPSFSAIKGHVCVIKDIKKIQEPEQNSSEAPQLEFMTQAKLDEMIKQNEIKEIGMVAALKMALE